MRKSLERGKRRRTFESLERRKKRVLKAGKKSLERGKRKQTFES